MKQDFWDINNILLLYYYNWKKKTTGIKIDALFYFLKKNTKLGQNQLC